MANLSKQWCQNMSYNHFFLVFEFLCWYMLSLNQTSGWKPPVCCISHHQHFTPLNSLHPKKEWSSVELHVCWFLGIPLHVFLSSPAVLFGWWTTGCEVYTSTEKRGQVETQRWTCRLTPLIVSPEKRDKWWKENKQGEAGYFSKSRTEVSNYIHSETCNLRWATHWHTFTHIYTHTHRCRDLTSAGLAVPSEQEPN